MRRAWGDDIAVTDAAGGARRDDVAVAASPGPPGSKNLIRTWETGYSPDGGSTAGIARVSRRTMFGHRWRRRLNNPALGAPGSSLDGGQATRPAGGTGSTGAARERGPSGAHPANATPSARNTACPAAAAGEAAEAASAAAGAHLPEEAAFADQTTHEQQASGFWRDSHVQLSTSSYRITSIRAADKWIPEIICLGSMEQP